MKTTKKGLYLGLLFSFFGVENVVQAYTITIENRTKYNLHYRITYKGNKCQPDEGGIMKSWSYSKYYNPIPIGSDESRDFATNGCLFKKIAVTAEVLKARPALVTVENGRRVVQQPMLAVFRSTDYTPKIGKSIGDHTFIVKVKNPSARPKNIKLKITRKR